MCAENLPTSVCGDLNGNLVCTVQHCRIDNILHRCMLLILFPNKLRTFLLLFKLFKFKLQFKKVKSFFLGQRSNLNNFKQKRKSSSGVLLGQLRPHNQSSGILIALTINLIKKCVCGTIPSEREREVLLRNQVK